MVKTQSEINKIFEPPKFNIPLKYSKLATMILLPIFYLPIFPLGMLFSLVGLIFFYWTQKVIVSDILHSFRNYSSPVTKNQNIDQVIFAESF